MSRVLFSPVAPLSRIWLLAVRKTSKPQSARYPARASGALKQGYPVYGFPPSVNSILAIAISASLISFTICLKYDEKSYVPLSFNAVSICLVCIMTSPIIQMLTVSEAGASNVIGKGTGNCMVEMCSCALAVRTAGPDRMTRAASRPVILCPKRNPNVQKLLMR